MEGGMGEDNLIQMNVFSSSDPDKTNGEKNQVRRITRKHLDYILGKDKKYI